MTRSLAILLLLSACPVPDGEPPPVDTDGEPPSCMGAWLYSACLSDEECWDHPEIDDGQGICLGGTCTYACSVDADCPNEDIGLATADCTSLGWCVNPCITSDGLDRCPGGYECTLFPGKGQHCAGICNPA